jgi:predicted transglutaminase-like cysteine proteinase
MMQAAGSMSEPDKIRRVNEFFNRRIQFGEDQAVWGENDYWATPLEFMGRGIGDCEDFSISKYFALRSLGVSNEKLRITYVKARIGGPQSTVSQAHMVLSYYPDPAAEPLILDNLLNDIRPASTRPDLTPLFSFNSEGLWVGASGTGTAARPTASSTARLSRWRDLLARMQADGFH